MATKISKSKKNSSMRALPNAHGKKHNKRVTARNNSRLNKGGYEGGSLTHSPDNSLTKRGLSSSLSDKSKITLSESIHGKDYKQELLNSEDPVHNYDKIFEEKLAAQYKEFRNFKENNIQMRKFLRLLSILLIIIILALLLLSFG